MTQRDSSANNGSEIGTPWILSGTSFELAEQAYVTWLASTERIQNEALGFLSQRFEKALTTARELGNCWNPADYFVVQAKYAEDALTDWWTESQRLAGLVGEIAQVSAAVAGVVEPRSKRSARNGNGGNHTS